MYKFYPNKKGKITMVLVVAITQTANTDVEMNATKTCYKKIKIN